MRFACENVKGATLQARSGGVQTWFVSLLAEQHRTGVINEDTDVVIWMIYVEILYLILEGYYFVCCPAKLRYLNAVCPC